MRARVFVALAVLSVALVVSGCFLLPGPPDSDPSIRGTITSITPGTDLPGSMLVEGSGAYDKASVNVMKDTEVLLQGADGWSRYTFGELKVGDEVEVWFTGAVAESYPVQTTADTIVLVK